MPELRAHERAGPGEPGPHRPLGDTERGGDLVVAEIGPGMQEQHLALPAVKPCEGRLEPRLQVTARRVQGSHSGP
jgi:hypothetical protein